nr:hypothetical protein HK105_006441 [Polyrhizophydium stewartii]
MQKPPVPGGPLVLPETHSYDLYAISVGARLLLLLLSEHRADSASRCDQNHFGGLNGGHYTAHVKNNYQKTWLNFDDSRIGRTDENPHHVRRVVEPRQRTLLSAQRSRGKSSELEELEELEEPCPCTAIKPL